MSAGGAGVYITVSGSSHSDSITYIFCASSLPIDSLFTSKVSTSGPGRSVSSTGFSSRLPFAFLRDYLPLTFLHDCLPFTFLHDRLPFTFLHDCLPLTSSCDFGLRPSLRAHCLYRNPLVHHSHRCHHCRPRANLLRANFLLEPSRTTSGVRPVYKSPRRPLIYHTSPEARAREQPLPPLPTPPASLPSLLVAVPPVSHPQPPLWDPGRPPHQGT